MKKLLVTLLVLAQTIFATATVFAQPGLVSCWKFDEGTGSTATDSADSNDGIIFGPSWVSGYVGNALSFNGIDDVVRVADAPNQHITESISIAAWIYPTAKKTQHVLIKGPQVNGDFAYPYALSTSATGDLIFTIRPNGVFTQVRKTGYSLNTWSFVAGTYDGVTMKLYENGVLVNSLAASGNLNESFSPLLIGTRLSLPSSTFEGIIDELSLYERALAPEEIEEHYLNGLLGIGCGGAVPEPTTFALVDIKPGSVPNPVNPKSKGVLSVAILGTEEFDVNDVDIDTLLFGDPLLIGNGGTAVSPLRNAYRDVSHDGFLDLTLKFSTADLVENDALGFDTVEGLLTGFLLDGTPFAGLDSIRIVPPNGSKGNSLQVSAVPEPTACTLALAALCLAMSRRRAH